MPERDAEMLGWKAGDPCGACGSTNTTWEIVDGATCLDCGRTDADE